MSREPIPYPTIEGYRFRPLRSEDLPALLVLVLAEARAGGFESSETLSDLEREFRDPWSPPETDAIVALDEAGEIAGTARAYTKPEAVVRDAFSFLALSLRPELEKGPLGHALVDWLAALGQDRLRAVAGDLPGQLRVACDRKQAERGRLFERHGFRMGRNFWRMRRDLRAPIDEPVLPAGCEARPFDPTFDEELMAAFNETFSDHWGFEPVDREDWRVFFTGSKEFRPDLTRVVLADGRIVGYSMNQVNEEECATLGERRGWIGQLGVRRSWRKLGMATALLNLSMRAFRAAGLDYAVLGVDSENLTGAVALYERTGFRIIREMQVFVRDAG